MISKVEELNKECYKGQLLLFTLLEYTGALAGIRGMPSKKHLHRNEKSYFTQAYTPCLRIFQWLKNNKQLSFLFIQEIEKRNYNADKLEEISENLIKLFFADFVSTDQNNIRILIIFADLIRSALSESKDTWYSYRPFVNKLIEGYFNRIENREYLKFIFKNALNEISLTEKEIEEEAQMSEMIKDEENEFVVLDPKSLEEKKRINSNDSKDLQNDTKLIMYEENKTESKGVGNTEYIKDYYSDLNVSESICEVIDFHEEIYNVCNHFVGSITTKLLYMPLSIRYLCKLIQKICNELFKENKINYIYKILKDLLYHCWWKIALFNPNAYDIIKISLGKSSSVKKKINRASDLLGKVLYGNSVPEASNYSSKLFDFI